VSLDLLQCLARGFVVTTPLGPADVVALRADPTAAALADAGDWSGLVEHLSATGHTCPRDLLTREQFLLTIAACGFRIAQLPEVPREGWKLTLSLILASTSVHVASAQVQGLLAMGIQQGVVTQAEADALTLQPCTRAESLLGRLLSPGQMLTRDDLQAALEV